MLLLDWRLALLSMIPIPIMIFVVYRAQRALATTYKKQQASTCPAG